MSEPWTEEEEQDARSRIAQMLENPMLTITGPQLRDEMVRALATLDDAREEKENAVRHAEDWFLELQQAREENARLKEHIQELYQENAGVCEALGLATEQIGGIRDERDDACAKWTRANEENARLRADLERENKERLRTAECLTTTIRDAEKAEQRVRELTEEHDAYWDQLCKLEHRLQNQIRSHGDTIGWWAREYKDLEHRLVEAQAALREAIETCARVADRFIDPCVIEYQRDPGGRRVPTTFDTTAAAVTIAGAIRALAPSPPETPHKPKGESY